MKIGSSVGPLVTGILLGSSLIFVMPSDEGLVQASEPVHAAIDAPGEAHAIARAIAANIAGGAQASCLQELTDIMGVPRLQGFYGMDIRSDAVALNLYGDAMLLSGMIYFYLIPS